MKYRQCERVVPALGVFVCLSGAAHAQVPLPTPGPVSLETRQKLRAAILGLATSKDPNIENVRPDLALPLAKLGDWNGAIRLLHGDLNAPRSSNELWHWRAGQLARAAKWGEVEPAAAHITHPATRADAYLFAARLAVDKNIAVNAPVPGSRELKALLTHAMPLLEKGGSLQQRAYAGYLWARAGDDAAAERIFARTLEAAKRGDARARSQALKRSKGDGRPPEGADSARSVLALQARAGLLLSALPHLDLTDEFVQSWWIGGARNQAELEALHQAIQKLPVASRISDLYTSSAKSSVRGEKVQARIWYDEARALEAQPDGAEPNANTRRDHFMHAMTAFYAAHFLNDENLVKETEERMRQATLQFPKDQEDYTDFPAMGALLDLEGPGQLGAAAALTPAQMDEIFARLRAMPPSDLQFRALGDVATYFYVRKQPAKLLAVANSMQESAQKLAAAEAAKRAKEKGFFNPYWPRTPSQITAIFWLQRAGDTASATRFAHEFAAHVPDKERPYAAMTLIQLGFPQLADSLFDPAREIPRLAAASRERRKAKKQVDWSAFSSWSDYAGTEARYRSPEAPLRWMGQLDDIYSRSRCLAAIVSALYPETPLAPPFVSVVGGGSSSSF